MHRMVNITLSIPEDLKNELRLRNEVNWSGVIRNALREHLAKIKIADAIASKSKLTRKDADEISRKIKREMARQHGLIK